MDAIITILILLMVSFALVTIMSQLLNKNTPNY
jgi:hypothetical protein